MNAAHLHLILNHAPLFATLFGLALLGYGWRFESRSVRFAGYIALGVSAVFSVLTYVSGSAAEDSIERLAGVARSLIDTHEDAAKVSLALALAAGALAVWGWGVEIRLHKIPGRVVAATLAAALLAMISFGYTAFVGGQIHHPEIRL